MATIVPEGTAVRKAVQWVTEELRKETNPGLPALLDQATFRFNLNPRESELLARSFREP